MRLPWINRVEHEALMAERQAQIDLLKETTALYREQIAVLLTPKAEILTPTPQPLPPKPPSIIAETIRAIAQGDTQLMAYLHKRKRELRSENPNMSDDGIAALLSTWESTEPVE